MFVVFVYAHSLLRWSSFHGSNRVGGTHAAAKEGGAAAAAKAAAAAVRAAKPADTSSSDKQTEVVVTEPLSDCIMCDNKANIRFNPCGHSVLCDECGQRATRCPEKGCGVRILVALCTYVKKKTALLKQN